MLTRRAAAKLLATAFGAHTLGPQPDAQASTLRAAFSVMMWTLKDRGTFEQNLDSVAAAGYPHIELVDEYKTWSPAATTRFLARMKALNLTVDAAAGMKLGFADPTGADAFLAELTSLLPALQRLSCRQIILLSGKRIAGATPEAQHAASIATLRRAAPVLESAGITGVIEPIDRLEQPAIYLDGVTEAFTIVQAVGSPRIMVLYDLYHEQRGFGNLLEKLQHNIAEVGLIHVADVPGRHQPGTGEIGFPNIYRQLAELHYSGIIAMEFYPAGDPLQTLRQAREDASH